MGYGRLLGLGSLLTSGLALAVLRPTPVHWSLLAAVVAVHLCVAWLSHALPRWTALGVGAAGVPPPRHARPGADHGRRPGPGRGDGRLLRPVLRLHRPLPPRPGRRGAAGAGPGHLRGQPARAQRRTGRPHLLRGRGVAGPGPPAQPDAPPPGRPGRPTAGRRAHRSPDRSGQPPRHGAVPGRGGGGRRPRRVRPRPLQAGQRRARARLRRPRAGDLRPPPRAAAADPRPGRPLRR